MSDVRTVIIYVWLSVLTILAIIYFWRVLFKNWKAKKVNLRFSLGPFSANTDLERIKREKEKADKSAEETIKKFEEKGKLNEKAISLAMKAVVENYKGLAEKQQNILLEEWEGKLKECKCEISPKTRTPYYDSANYGYTYCEKCETTIKGAGKHGVIKNRNNPNFWGLEIKEKVLCLECLEKYREKMPVSKKYMLNKYLKRGY